jgi:hypothetical protein
MCISVITTRAVNFFTLHQIFYLCANCSHIYIIILETLPINEVEVAESLFFSFWRRVEDKSQDSGLEFIKLKGTHRMEILRDRQRGAVHPVLQQHRSGGWAYKTSWATRSGPKRLKCVRYSLYHVLRWT